ncbi:MAG: nickel pincer cofactor biosynthesis protein LarC [Candidatus Latescibacterota bacterium]|jgi:uncharacterized protein (TIGR00299 family) protein
MAKTLLIDPFHGASGDMLLASLVDAGCPVETIRGGLTSITELSKVKIDVERVTSGVFACARMKIDLPPEHAHRGLSAVSGIIQSAQSLSDRVKERSVAAFTLLAKAEARVHGMTVDEIHFHEVGALDAIVDVVGFFVAVESLGVESLRYTRLVVGSGETESMHGKIPVPAPATLELLEGHRVEFSGRNEELITPTAAAIVASSFEPLPPDAGFTPEALGYGAGTRKSKKGQLPNILRVALGRMDAAPASVSIIRTTIDDMNPEFYGHTMELLFAQGALEVYYHPVMMKKNRPGVEVTVITETKDERRLADELLAQTSTLGVRLCREQRVELERRKEKIKTEIGEATVKVAILPGGGERMSPEYESCKSLAAASGRSLIDVFEIVRSAWRTGRDG